MAFAAAASNRHESFFEEDFTHDASDAAHGGSPEKILDTDANFIVKVEERGREPILRNKQDAGESHGRGDESAPANLGAITFS